MSILAFLHNAFGFIYFFTWSATFWPQVLLVFRRKTTAGLSTDFMAINIVGFIAYSIFTFASYFVPAVDESYTKITSHGPQVEIADVFFAAHGAVMCAILVVQLFIFPPRIPPKPYVTVGCALFQTAVLVGLFGAAAGKFEWYTYLSFAGGVKVLSSLIKHFPQVFLNRARGSTVGWSFTMVVLDIVGGAFSMAQQTVRCIQQHNFAPFTSNLAKTILAAESLLFDFYFVAQHLIFYTDRNDPDKGKSAEDDLQLEEESLVLDMGRDRTHR